MRYRRGIDARALCRDGAGRILVVADHRGAPALPGGPVGHGEHPADAAARWGGAAAAVPLTVGRPLRVVTELRRDRRGPWSGAWRHTDTIVFAGAIVLARGAREPAVPATGDWVAEQELATGPVAVALGLAPESVDGLPRVAWSAVAARGGRRQRFGAYGLVRGRGTEVLLTLIADGYPGAGLWHLPGGGTDFGERAQAALYREIVEETAQEGEIGALLSISHHHDGRGRDGRSMDWHGVRAVYAVRVDRPTAPRVLEAGGSTSAAAWFPIGEALGLRLTEVARQALTASAS